MTARIFRRLAAIAAELRAGLNTADAPPDLSSQERAERRALGILAGLVAALLLWAALAPIDRIVRAEGRIVAAARAQIVQHLEGGIVEAIAVREGESVRAGQLLMRLSDVQANKDVQQGVSRMQALQATQARLQAESEGSERIEFPAAVGEDYRRRERSAFNERAKKLRSELAALQQQIKQRRAELAETQLRAKNYATEIDLARQQSQLLEGLHRRGAASQLELIEAQSRTQRMLSAQGEAMAAIPRLSAAIGEMESRLAEADARFRADARLELSQVGGELERLGHALSGDSDRLARTEVRAPVGGFVNRLHFNTLGGVVKPGEPILEITPSDGPLAVEARVRPDDRAALRPGLSTRVVIGAYDYAVYGALDGRLTEVSADTLPDEKGSRYYRVTIEARPADGPLAREVILPGMTARADIVLGQRSVLSYLLSPLLKFSTQTLREPR